MALNLGFERFMRDRLELFSRRWSSALANRLSGFLIITDKGGAVLKMARVLLVEYDQTWRNIASEGLNYAQGRVLSRSERSL